MPVRDPLVRRLIVGTMMAAVFVGVAIRYFGLGTNLALQFLISSVAMVLAMILLAFVAGWILGKLRRRPPGFLDDEE